MHLLMQSSVKINILIILNPKSPEDFSWAQIVSRSSLIFLFFLLVTIPKIIIICSISINRNIALSASDYCQGINVIL